MTGIIAVLVFSFSVQAQDKEFTRPAAIAPRMNSIAMQNAADTIKVLAIMVEFQQDDLETTSGDGTFESAINEDPYDYDVDPLPHDRQYFQDQLLFLKNFYQDISGNNVIIDITNAVHPVEAAFLLPYPMWHYNHNDDDYLDEGLSLLFYDAWKAADSLGEIDFSKFDPDNDCFIIFHAGVGKDFAFDFDPTPFDIPSAYMELEDLVEYNNIPDDGIPVDSGNYFIKRGMILPETENQEGYNLGMHGHLSILFAHHLGIPNLYDTETGQSVIGLFGMMDQGSGKLDGLVPAPPSAWTKIYMGWETPVIVEDLPADVEVPLGTIIKVPLNGNEYFLIENIESYVYDGVTYDSLRYKHYVDTGEYADAYQMLTEYIQDSVGVSWSRPGVLVDIEDWGIGRPASGLIIWHIDEFVTQMGLESNTININPDHRGVDLEEADGAQDIGEEYGLFNAGYGTELGSPFDAFYAGNEEFLDANPEYDYVTFADNTFPDARSYSNAKSHLRLSNFSVIADTMTFTIENDIQMPGFPITFDNPVNILNADIDGIDGDELLTFSGDELTAWNENGEEIANFVFDDEYSTWQFAANDFDDDGSEEAVFKKSKYLYYADFNPADSSFIVNRVNIGSDTSQYFPVHFLAGNDSLIFISAQSNNPVDTLSCWRIVENAPQLKWLHAFEDTSENRFQSILPNGDIVILSNSGNAVRLDNEGGEIWNSDVFTQVSGLPQNVSLFSIAAGDVDQDGGTEIIAFGLNESDYFYFRFDAASGQLEEWSALDILPPPANNDPFTIIDPTFTPALVDIDDDGFLEILFQHNAGVFYVLEYNGLFSGFFPYELAGNGNPHVSPVIGTVNSGNKEIYFSYYNTDSYSYEISGIDDKAVNLPDFPAAVDDDVRYRLFNFGGNQHVLAMVGNISHKLNVWKIEAESVLWGSQYGDKRNTAYAPNSTSPTPSSSNLMPENMVFNWPNPNNPGEDFTHIRYYLNHDANINIRIYDMAGDLVDELSNYGMGQAYNETDWDLTNIASGVYFARVEAEGGGQSAVKFIKIAVIK